MSYEVNFTIPGKAQAKQRPKFNRLSGRAYTPKQTISFENWVKDCYFRSISSIDNKPTDKPLKVSITMYVEIPQSKSKKQKEKMLTGEIKPIVKPDVDNVAKSILDALNGIIYLDDKQVVDLRVRKQYAEVPSVSVWISEVQKYE